MTFLPSLCSVLNVAASLSKRSKSKMLASGSGVVVVLPSLMAPWSTICHVALTLGCHEELRLGPLPEEEELELPSDESP